MRSSRRAEHAFTFWRNHADHEDHPSSSKYNPATLSQVSSLPGKFTRVPDLGRTPRSKFNHRDRQGREDLAECESCRAILQFQSDEIATGQNLAQPGTLRQSRNWQKGLR